MDKYLEIPKIQLSNLVNGEGAYPYIRIVHGNDSRQTSTKMTPSTTYEWVDEQIMFLLSGSDFIIQCWDWNAGGSTQNFLGEIQLVEKEMKDNKKQEHDIRLLDKNFGGKIKLWCKQSDGTNHKRKYPPVDPSLKIYKDFGINVFHSIPNYKMALILGNYEYTDPELVGSSQFTNYVKSDVRNIRHWLEVSCEFKIEEPDILINKSATDFQEIYKDFKNRIWKKREEVISVHHKEKQSLDRDETQLLRSQNRVGGKCGILIFVYYSGHGVMSEGHTYVVCPDYEKKKPKKKAVIDIDLILAQMASIPDTFVVSLLDCCRMPVVFGEEGEGEREREEKREEKHDPRATDYFGGDCVRIYSTSAGTATLERCEKTEKGSKITCKFIKHAKTYGFPEFPHGTSFWAFMQVCLQYQVDVKQYGTKSVNLTTLSLSKIDTLRTYQKMFLMTKKEIDFLYSQFKRLDKDESLSISPHELLHDLTIFGFNYKKEEIDAIPHLSKNKKNNLEIFLKKWKEEVEKIQQLDKDTTRLSFEEFLLLFVRSQTNLHWNDLLPPYYKEKKIIFYAIIQEVL